MLRRAAVAAALVVTLGACGGDQTPPDSNPLDGLITSVAAGSIVVVTEDGGSFTFDLADSTVTLEHLQEHRSQRLPVRVTWEQRSGDLTAIKVEDA